MNENDETLVRILARTDAVFLPLRRWEPQQRVTATYEARQAYRSAGVPWHVGGGAADRQRGARTLARLEKATMLTVFRSAVRPTGVRLRPFAEARARALAGLPPLPESRKLLRRVAALQEASARGNGAWESWLAGVEWKDTREREARQKLVAVEEKALPALVRRWLLAGSTLEGHVCYMVTEAGREALGHTQDGESQGAAPEETARRLYYEELKEAQASLLAQAPQRPGELGMIPIPLCEAGWGAMRHLPEVSDAEGDNE